MVPRPVWELFPSDGLDAGAPYRWLHEDERATTKHLPIAIHFGPHLSPPSTHELEHWQEPTAESKVAECVPEEERPLLERLAAAAQLHDDLKSRAAPPTPLLSGNTSRTPSGHGRDASRRAELHAELRLGEPESSKRLTAAHSKEPHSCAPPSSHPTPYPASQPSHPSPCHDSQAVTAAAKRVAAASSKAEKSDRGDLRSDLRSEIRSEIKSEIKSDAKGDAKSDKPPPAKKAPPRLAPPPL